MSAAGGAGRTPFVAGNWKMHKTGTEAKAFIDELLPLLPRDAGVDVALCPPFTALASTLHAVRDAGIMVLAQNMHYQTHGAFTGEVAPTMLTAVGVAGAIVGHSERRELFGETDRALALKVPAALEHGLIPILCVGETEEERDAGDTERKLRHQVKEDLARVDTERLAEVVIAYEPIWAIGTGRVATPEQAQDALAFVRALVGDRSPEQAERIRLLYGGSVNSENAAELLALPDVDGALVGGASLKPDSFAAIVAAAR
jgi:triosephosphate isomerase